MARYTGPKDRLSRREVFDLFGAGAKLTRLNVPPGMHGPRGIKNKSQYGRQLREKQKVKRIYGILEKQFKKYVTLALKSKGNTGERLLGLLETRLDNVVYRLGLASSRPAARQLVAHRHVLVNGAKVNIPSYRVRVGESVSLASGAKGMTAAGKPPAWLEKKALVGRLVREPKREDVLEPISEQEIVEFYSR